MACARSIFLVDHAWTCHVEHARQQLQQIPGLLHRMANLMGIEFHGELPSAAAVDQVLEEMWKFNQTYQLSHGVSAGRGEGGADTDTGGQEPGPSRLHPTVSKRPFPEASWYRLAPANARTPGSAWT